MVALTICKSVLREINQVNAGLVLASVYALADSVAVEGCLPLETARPKDLGLLLAEVGTTADRLGSMLAAVHGGRVAFPHAADTGYSAED